ncbi:hypothetical protein LBMAG47_11210 [Planctomycetia bacterium]|nr:hypothetical protein LBMAG47_11210 [Planctomycetia bacterium]
MPPPMANWARKTWKMPRPPITSPFMSGPTSMTGKYSRGGISLMIAREYPGTTRSLPAHGLAIPENALSSAHRAEVSVGKPVLNRHP